MKKLLLCSALLAGLCGPVAAFPDKPLKLVVPYTPGGSADLLARALAEGMGRQLGQPVVVENRPGANTMIAASGVARAPADGYTLLLASSASLVLNPMLYRKISYDAQRDLRVLSVAAETPLVVVANAQVPASGMRDFASYAKANAGRLNYASVGLGNPLQLATEMLKTELGIELTHVPYNGSAPALASLLAGDVQLMVDVVSTSLPHIRTGKLKALAVTTRQRLSVLPDTPTVAESGSPDFHVVTWFGIAAPKGIAESDAAKLQAAVSKVLADPQFRRSFESQGLLVLPPQQPAETTAYVERERARWATVIKSHNIALD